jgi:hypothetical protein
MTSSVLAALLAIAAALHIWFSGNRISTALMTFGFITLGYVSGNGSTTFGGWIAGIISGVTTFINWIAGAF